MQNVSVTSMSYLMRRRPPERNNITTTSVVKLRASLWGELPISDISKEMAGRLDAGVVLREK
jgi:hypothetical protein